MLKVVIGHSDDVDAEDAIEETLQQCTEKLAGEIPQAALLYAGIDFEHQVILDAIHEAFPGIELIGCSGDAEISSLLGVVEDSVVLALFCSDTITFSVGVGRNVASNPEEITNQAVKEASAKLSGLPKLCFTAYETLTTSGLEILTGIKNALPPSIPVLGGAASDHFQMEKSFQFAGREILQDSVPVLLIGGDLKYSFGVASGRNTTGDKEKVTSVKGNRVYRIADMTAVEFYTKYLGELDKVIGEFPLAVFDENAKESYLRAPAQYFDDGSIAFFADIPEGSEVQLTVANRDGIISAVKTAYDMAQSHYPGSRPEVMQVTSCAGRKSVLGTRVREEFSILRKKVGDTLPIIGYYGFGEICPLDQSADSKFHNETIVILLLGVE